MKKFNISKPEKYVKDGVEKTYWNNVGTMTEFQKQDGTISRIIEIPAIGLKASVFEQQAREDRPAHQSTYTDTAPARPAPAQEETIDYPAEDINPEDIPF